MGFLFRAHAIYCECEEKHKKPQTKQNKTSQLKETNKGTYAMLREIVCGGVVLGDSAGHASYLPRYNPHANIEHGICWDRRVILWKVDPSDRG